MTSSRAWPSKAWFPLWRLISFPSVFVAAVRNMIEYVKIVHFFVKHKTFVSAFERLGVVEF